MDKLQEIQKLLAEAMNKLDALSLPEMEVMETPEPSAEGDLPHRFDKIFLEVGHGAHPDGFEPGAVDQRSGAKEHDLNKICANSCLKRLNELGFHNIEILDPDDYLFNIGKLGSAGDVFISIHHNSFYDDSAQGSEALVHPVLKRPQDEKLAGILAEHMSKKLEIPNRGIKEMKLSVLAGACDVRDDNAVCLVEPYFISGNQVSINKAHEVWSTRSGVAIAEGIDAFLKG